MYCIIVNWHRSLKLTLQHWHWQKDAVAAKDFDGEDMAWIWKWIILFGIETNVLNFTPSPPYLFKWRWWDKNMLVELLWNRLISSSFGLKVVRRKVKQVVHGMSNWFKDTKCLRFKMLQASLVNNYNLARIWLKSFKNHKLRQHSIRPTTMPKHIANHRPIQRIKHKSLNHSSMNNSIS